MAKNKATRKGRFIGLWVKAIYHLVIYHLPFILSFDFLAGDGIELSITVDVDDAVTEDFDW